MSTLKQTNDNPAKNIRRVVFLSREPRSGESQVFDSLFGSSTDLRRESWKEDFDRPGGSDLSAKMEQDSRANPNTAYVILGDNRNHSVTAAAAITANSLGTPLCIVQLKEGTDQIERVDIYQQNERYVHSLSKVGAGITPGSTAR